MKPAALLAGLALLLAPTTCVMAQVPSPPSVITADPTGNGCDITLSRDAPKTLTDQVWIVVDGKSEGFGGGNFSHSYGGVEVLHYMAAIKSDLDEQVKDILKAQGVHVKANVTTYRISYGVHAADTYNISKSLHFRHECGTVTFLDFTHGAEYKIGDKIPVFGAVLLDSSITMRQAIGPHNDIYSGRFAHLPNDLLHRITIQVQFVPKMPETQ